MKKNNNMIVLVDTREQARYKFKNAVTQTLKTGDYSLAGHSGGEEYSGITIERKCVNELFTITGRGRKRFIRELERMTDFDSASIVIQGNLEDIFTTYEKNMHFLEMNYSGKELDSKKRNAVTPKKVINSIASWTIKYNIPFLFAGNRELARAFTYRLLEKYWKYNYEKNTTHSG